MIAAAAGQPASHGLPFNWFDAVVVAVLAFGLFRGRRSGMSKEFLPLLQWLVLVPVCSFFYPLPMPFFINTFQWSKTASSICSYIIFGFAVLLFFGILRKFFEERMAKSGAFKDGEYYLGMLSGLVRAACIILVALALLNAPVYSQADIEEHTLYVKNTYGGGMYSGDYFPSMQEIQEQVFKKSYLGPVIQNNLGMFLINNSPAGSLPSQKPKPVLSIGK